MTEETGKTQSARLAIFLSLFGKVQKAGFRKKLKAACESVGVTGWVRNMPEGHVEAWLEGDRQDVGEVVSDIHAGELGARIESVLQKSVPGNSYDTFQVLTGTRRIEADKALFPNLPELARFTGFQNRQTSRKMLRVLSEEEKGEARDENLNSFLKEMPPRFLPEPLSRKRSFREALNGSLGSFAHEIWARSIFNNELSASGIVSPERLINRKKNGQAFMRALGHRVPEVFESSVELEHIEPRTGIVVKPVEGAGSKGVFAFLSEDRILNVGENRILGSFGEFFADARRHAERKHAARRWMVEELILNRYGELPNDLKFYCFYGRCPLVLEVNRSEAGTRHCWWNEKGLQVETGKYGASGFSGSGFEPELLALAAEVSKSIPVPFMRIDFFQTFAEPVFGEFTPKPGLFHEFDETTDTLLGEEFARARARLLADLYTGKRFSEYDGFVESLNTGPDSRGSAA